MLTVYIAVALLQPCFCQELDHEHSSLYQEEIPITSEEAFAQYIEYNIVENNENKTPYLTIGTEYEEEDDSISTFNYNDPEKTHEKIINTGNEENEENLNSRSAEVPNIEEVTKESPSNEVPINIRFSNPVKTDGKVTIVAYIRCGDDKETTINEIEQGNGDLDEEMPVSFYGPVKAQGKVSISAHFGCGENGNTIASASSSAEATGNDIDMVNDDPDGVSFGGSVHAKGKVSVGNHFGCGGPIGIPPIFLPMPWLLTFPYPHYPAYCPYSVPDIFLAQYPFPMPDTRPFTSHGIQDYPETESRNIDGSAEILSVASTLANSNPCHDDDQHQNMAFNGVVPACGTVKIAARF